MAQKSPAAKKMAAARARTAEKQAALARKKKEPEKLASKKQTAKRVRKQQQIARDAEIERKQNKTQSVIILCACTAAALILSNWDALVALFS